MSLLRTIVAVIGFGGALLFGAAFVVSYARPALVEQAAATVVRNEVERRVRETAFALDGGALAEIAARAAPQKQAEIARVHALLADSVAARVARVAAEMRDPDCPCRRPVAGAALGWRLVRLSQLDERLTALARARYLDVTAQLMREFRIFTAANALVLLFLGIAVVTRPSARLHLLPPAVILVCSAALVGLVYLFGQDWLHTIVFSSYLGLWYFAYLGAAFVLLGDVVLNRGRITTHLLNAGSGAVGSTAAVLPC
jgi:hypothetical protein